MTSSVTEATQALDAPIEISGDPIHHWFNLTYASYLCLPRSVLQSMPDEWQERLVQLLGELEAKCAEAGIELPETTVRVKDGRGRFVHDWLADYERGRRNVFTEGGVR